MAPEDRKRLLLETGLTLFGRKAFEGVTLDEICAAAGVSRPLLQHYYGSKRTFFIAVVAYGIDVLEATVREKADDGGFSALEGNLARYFAFIRDHPVGATLMNGAGGVPEVIDLINGFRQRTIDLVLEVLPAEARTAEAVAAIHCWNGVNEMLTARLIDEPSLSTAWAARFSQNALFALLSLATGEQTLG